MGNATFKPQSTFRCPVCLGHAYRQVVVKRADGADYATAFFMCTGCTSMFIDPGLFAARGDPVRFALECAYESEAAARVEQSQRDVMTDETVAVEWYHFDYTHYTPTGRKRIKRTRAKLPLHEGMERLDQAVPVPESKELRMVDGNMALAKEFLDYVLSVPEGE